MLERPDLKKESPIPRQLIELEDTLQAYLQETPPIEEFSDIIPPGEIEADRAEVARLKEIFAEKENEAEKELHAYAQVLEMIVMEFSNAWLPGYLSKASEYDDFKRQTDLFLEIQGDGDDTIRMALDVTSSTNKAGDKIKNVLNELKGNSLHDVKYFRSELDETAGRQKMPRFIIGADLPEISELAALYIRFKKSESPEIRAEILQEIRGHRFGADIQDELIGQARRYHRELKQAAIPQAESAENRDLFAKIEKIIQKQKEKTPEHGHSRYAESRERKSNRVLEAIDQALA